MALRDTLSVLLPSPAETALLTACLCDAHRARDAWSRWRAGRTATESSLRNDLAETRTLLPLLARSVARNELWVEPGVHAYLQATTLREELRAGRYRHIVAQALAGLDQAGVTVCVVRGAALAATAYDAWSHRHCHDVDLLVRSEQLERALGALRQAGCLRMGATPAHCSTLVRHTSGLQFAVHTQPFGLPYYAIPLERFLCNSQTISINGVAVSTPSREAMLAHVLGHATYSPSRRNLRWVADAWHLVARHPELDWSEVVGCWKAGRLPLPVSVLLDYLADLDVAVPSDVRRRMQQLGAAADATAHDVALGGAFASVRGDFRSLWRSTHSWRGRARVARWVVAPSPGYLRNAFPLASAWLVPLCYGYRPGRFLLNQLTGRLRR